MSRLYKNKLHLKDRPFGNREREILSSDVLDNSTPLPNTVVYEDIDKEMHRWVDEELQMSFEGKRLPLMDLFSNQRFSEYLQSWKFVDENNNLILNFKTLTRENNPNKGTLNGETRNIPGERTYLLKRVNAADSNNRKYYIDYRMKQPFTVDMRYTISVMTNRYELINRFNMMVNDKFKSITNYIQPKGYYMPINLDSVSDESQYNIDDRQFYSQSYEIILKAFIITEDSLEVVEVPKLQFIGFEGERTYAAATIEEAFDTCPQNPYHYVPIILRVNFDCCEKSKFTMDCNFMVQKIEKNEYISSYRLYENDTEIVDRENFILHKDSEVKINKLYFKKRDYDNPIEIVFYGYDMDETYNENIEYVEKKDEINCEME